MGKNSDKGVRSTNGNERDWSVNSQEAEDFWTNRYAYGEGEGPEPEWVSHRWWEDEGKTLADFPPLENWRARR